MAHASIEYRVFWSEANAPYYIHCVCHFNGRALTINLFMIQITRGHWATPQHSFFYHGVRKIGSRINNMHGQGRDCFPTIWLAPYSYLLPGIACNLIKSTGISANSLPKKKPNQSLTKAEFMFTGWFVYSQYAKKSQKLADRRKTSTLYFEYNNY